MYMEEKRVKLFYIFIKKNSEELFIMGDFTI